MKKKSQKKVGKTPTRPTPLAVAVALSLLPAAVPVSAADFSLGGATGSYTAGDIRIGEPQSEFGFTSSANPDDMPAKPNSLFSYTSPSGNDFTIQSGTVAGHVFGGIANESRENANNNKVTIEGTGSGTTTIGTTANGGGGNITGGWSHTGSATGNSVTIGNATVRGITFGAWIRGGTGGVASGNSVTIGNGTTLRDNLYGAYSQGGQGSVTGNTVTIDGSNINVSNVQFIAGGYANPSPNLIQGNSVTIRGDATSTVRAQSIFGGRGMSSATVTGNTVNIGGTNVIGNIHGGHGVTGSIDTNEVIVTGGTVAGNIYGGFATTRGNVTGNRVRLSGGTVAGDIYGGYSTTGAATGNFVHVDNNNSLALGASRLFGGGTSGGGDAFSNNTLEKGADVTVNWAGNFQRVNFYYGGNANIGTLNTTPTGSAAGGTTLNTAEHNVTFGGAIEGSGDLKKDGTGTLIITGDNNRIIHSAGVTVYAGKLQIGDGGATGNITTPQYALAPNTTLSWNRNNDALYGGPITGAGTLLQEGTGTLILTGDGSSVGAVNITHGTLQLGDNTTSGSIRSGTGFNVGGTGSGSDATAALAYRHGNAVTETQQITGAGRLIQRGTGSLTIANVNTFTGGTEIESGSLIFTNSGALNLATDVNTRAGYLTFTGTGGSKVAALANSNPILLSNSFRTQVGAGDTNIVDLTSSPEVWLSAVEIGDEGGAFYVADNTVMDVKASALMLTENVANTKANDLYIGQNGTFNLKTGNAASFRSGIFGGTNSKLNISATAPFAVVQLMNADDSLTGDPTFSVGSTEITGSAATPLAFNLARETTNENRVVFSHTGDFSIHSTDGSNAAVMLVGAGTVTANNINVNNAALYPVYADLVTDTNNVNNLMKSTLSLEADNTITLTNFVLGYKANGTQEALGNESGFPTSNNSLLNLNSGSGKTIMEKGMVDIRTAPGLAFEQGDYLVIRSDKGIVDTNNAPIIDPAGQLTAYVDGFLFQPKESGLRGALTFISGNDTTPGSGNNIWLAHGMNSLSMDWTGVGGAAATARSGGWQYGDLFYSLQTAAGNAHETRFISGDKVYISGTGTFDVALPKTSTDATPGLSSKIVTSGLVVGRSTHGNNTDGGAYTISGAGGIIADSVSAVGTYATLGDNNSTDASALYRTGKLQKYGSSTLTFINTGTNTFMEGIDLYGGTTQFTRAEQLTTSYIRADGNPGGAEGIRFESDGGSTAATLEALASVTLREKVTIANNFTGTLAAAQNATFTHTGVLTGDSSTLLNKSGAGTVRLDETASAFAGKASVSAGTLDVTGNYGAMTGFAVKNSGTLSGTGTIGGNGAIEAGGTLSPGGLTRFASTAVAPVENPLAVNNGNLTFAPGSAFNVRITEHNGNPYSDSVKLTGTATIDAGANINVGIDNWGVKIFNYSTTNRFTVIDAGSAPANPSALFTLSAYLPRGIFMDQGWNSKLFQLWFGYDPGKGFGNIDGGTHNQNEIGDSLDKVIQNRDPGLWDLADRLSDPGFDDKQVRQQLDQLNGDLTANALYMAFKEPWRHPFNRLGYVLSVGDPKERKLYHPQAWVEVLSRHEEADSDGNGHGFNLHRSGVAFGVDTWVTPHTVVGAAFRYTKPRLSQTNGYSEADDYEAGLYGMTRLPGEVDMKMYLGYSHQNYDFTRNVYLPATPSGRYGAMYERLDGGTSGDAMAASVELTRAFPLQENFRLLPVAALDFEKVWLDGYKESTGQTALEYGGTSMQRTTLRLGLNGEYTWQNRLGLKAWTQYGRLVGGQDYPSVHVRFRESTLTNQPAANIYGNDIGKNYLNVGFGANWKLDDKGDKFVFLGYDGKFNNRLVSHSGEIRLLLTW